MKKHDIAEVLLAATLAAVVLIGLILTIVIS